MAGKAQTTKKLLDYVKKIAQEMERAESVTSHVFSSFLYNLSDVQPSELLPQIGTTKGQIDYFYLPESSKDITYFIELKSLNSIKEDNLKLKQIEKYMKSNFPPILKTLKRSDLWRIGIFTDLRVLVILLRRSDWGNKSEIFISKPVTYKLANIDQLFIDLGNLFKMEVGEIAKKILWDNTFYRYKIIRDELWIENKSELYKKAYNLWLLELDSNGGKGWPPKFAEAYSTLFGFMKKNNSAESNLHREACIKVLENKEIRELVMELFRDKYSVSFGKGNTKKILEDIDL